MLAALKTPEQTGVVHENGGGAEVTEEMRQSEENLTFNVDVCARKRQDLK